MTYDVAVANLPLADTLTGAELLPIYQGGRRVLTTLQAACLTKAPFVGAPAVVGLPGADAISGAEITTLFQNGGLRVATLAAIASTHTASFREPQTLSVRGAEALLGGEYIPVYQAGRRVLATINQIAVYAGTQVAPSVLAAVPTSASLAANAAAGTLLFAIGNVPAGVTPTVSPNDGRFAIAGDATNGWKVVTGATALSASSVDVTTNAAGATSVKVTVTITAAPATNSYAAVTQNSAPTAYTLASPSSDTFVASAGSTLAGSATGPGTWVNMPLGSNPGAHSRNSDGSGVGGNAAGRAGSYLSGIVSADGEVSADVTMFVTASEGQVSVLARLDTTSATGTYYELRFAYNSTFVVIRVNNGTETALQYGAVPAGIATGTYSNIRLRLVDIVDSSSGTAITTTAIRAWLNGAELISIIDTAPLPAGLYGIRGGRNVRFKNFKVGGWQLQSQVAFTPNVYDQSAAGAIVTMLQATTAGATLSLTSDDGGRFVLVDTGSSTNGRKIYSLVAGSTVTKVADGNARSVQIAEAKPNYTTLQTTLGFGVVAPLPARSVRLASAGGKIPNSIVDAGSGGQTFYKSQVPFFVGSDDRSRLQFVFDNWQLAAGEITGKNTGLTITKAAFHIPSAPIPLVPVTFAGSRQLNLADGDAAIPSDFLFPAQFGLTVFPRGMMGFLRSAGRTAAGISGRVQSIPTGIYIGSSAGGFFEKGGSGITDTQVDATANMYGEGGVTNNQAYSASAMWGTAVNTGNIPSVFFYGDSITEGLQDFVGSTVYGGKGWSARSISDDANGGKGTAASLIAAMQGSHSGDSNWASSAGATTRISKHWAACNILHDAIGTNDIGSFGTGSANSIHNSCLSLYSLYRAASPGGKILRSTLQARSLNKITLASLSGDGTALATATVSAGQPLPAVGATFPITIAGATPTGYNGTFTATATSSTTFTFPIASGLASPATGTITAADSDQSPYFQTPQPGWTVGGVRDQLIAQFRADLTAGTIDGISDTNLSVSPANDNTRWSAGTVTTESDSLNTHPYGTGGNAPIAVVVRSAVLNLTGLAA
jgi:hypothetical protein